ncbi:hypothetical protein PTNB29_07146 [Pyrenophora teres f. teres]|nr:hypothetical protein PTNB29_07146 [Pyrenophora teres f. teres]
MVHQVEVAREPEIASYWAQWKEDATPCYFPSLIENSVARSGRSEQNVILDILKRHYRNLSDEETRLDVLTAWSIVLQLFTGNASVSFRLTSQSGRSRLCSAAIERDTTVNTVRSMLREGLAQSENFKVSDIDSNPGFLASNGRLFCNTAVILDADIPTEEDDMAICLHLHESNHAAEAKLIYSRACLEEDHAADIVSTFQQVLSEVMTKPAALYSELQVLHPISSRKLFEWNAVTPASVDRCVGELFEDQANYTSTNMAIHASDASFTYAELESASRKIAMALQAKSVGPEDVVLLSFPKSAWAVVAMMAVVRAGATMLFFDISHPTARLQEIQNQVQAKIMLTAPQYADAWGWTGAEVLVVDSHLVDSLVDRSLLTSIVQPNNSLYIIYTSGSTGKPKGCCVEHRQFLTGSYAQGKASGMRATDLPEPESEKGIQLLQGHFETAEQVKQDVSAHLPAYMVPSLWIVASSIPLSISGKLNRSAVTQFTNSIDDETYNLVTGDVSEVAVIPASPVEEILQQACGEILNVPASSICLNRSFIHNGLDSILGMQLLSRLRAAGIAVSMQDMLASKSLSELAERAQTGDAATTLQTYPISYDLARFESEILPDLPVQAEEIEEVYPLGIMQRGILLSQQRESASYELRILCRATLPHGRESMDIDRLKNAWKSVSNRHASLRTVFTPSLSDDSPCDQLVLKTVEPQISIVSCRNEADVRHAVHQYTIANADKGQRPRVDFVIYMTGEHLYCMAAVDHALIDGVSVLLMFRDLSAAYAGDLDLTRTTRFSHYVGYLQQQDRSVSMDFWKQYLQGISTCHFPVLNDNSHGPNELHELTASVDQSLGLHNFCRTHNITPASLLHLAWAMTLRAYSGTEDVCFGYLSAGRDLLVQDMDDAVGAYINMLVCRMDLGELASSSLLQLAESVQQSFLKSMPHQLCSLADIQHELQLRGPLFNTVLSLQSALGDIIQASKNSIAFEIVDEVDLTEYDISVNIAIARDDVHLSFRHYTSKVSDEMASNVLGTFQNMIRVIVQDHEKRLNEIDLLSENDKHQILSWNEMVWEDHQRCIHDIISEQARRKPNALAIDAHDGRLTYAELDSISSLLASYLSELGVGPETLVPLCFKKSMWVPVAQMAVLKAGGACVAMDPTHPEKRRDELLQQCDAKMALTSPEYIHLFDKLVGKALAISKPLLDGLLEKQFTLPKTWIRPTPSNPCFVVFTSGSTGKPKGIVLEHHALASSSAAHGPIMQYNQPRARILQFASYTFDVSIGETFSGLQMGATVCIPAEEERLDDLAGVINRMNINIAYLTPSVASLLEPSDVPGLKVLALGGEAVRAENVAAWADKLHLIDIYGPAETSVYSTGLCPVTSTDAPGNIGFGLGALAVIALRESSTAQEDTKTIRLIDPSHNSVAADKIAQGRAYLGKRVPGYMMPSVWLCFDILPLSRNEKTDRVRVLQYVQEMASIPGLATAKPEEQTKVSAPLNSTETTVQGIVAAVLGQPQSKISMDQSFVGMAGDSIQAMQAVAKCRTNGLSVTVKDVLVSKSLRDLAKKARPISSTPNRKIGSDEPFALLANATLEALDKDVKKIGYSGSDDLEDAYPASPMQQGLLIAQAQASGNYKFFALCEATALKSGVKVSVEGLRAAWQQVVNRHAILRTVFVETSNASNDDVSALYTQAVLKQFSARQAQVGDYRALLDQPWTNPIDYEDGLPLHRFTVYENVTESKVYFNLEISHTLIDGASMAIILRDLVSAYQHQSQGPAPLYRNYISMLVERQHPEVENSLTYWSQYLEGVEPCIMPKLLLDQSAPIEDTLENVKVNLPSDTVKKLHAFSKANAVTLASILQTAWAIVVRAYSSNPDVVFGFLASGRDISLDGLENALGPYINMLICRVDANSSNKDSILTTIQKAQSDYLDSLAHQHTPLSQIQHSILDASAGSRLFNSVLSIQRPLSTDDDGNEIKIECVQSYDPTEYDCSVSITASEAVVEANISYMSTYYTTQQATRIGKTFSKILTDMLQDPAAPLTSLEFITPEDKQIILRRNKNGVVPLAAQDLIHAQVVRQAVERPSAPAIASWDGSYSYEELVSVAGRLAHHLRNNGVATEQKVLLAFDKSKWAIVSMLAVLLAGGTYLSIDPAHPPQHHRNIIEQAEPILLLTGSKLYAGKLKAVIETVTVVDETLLAQLQDHSELPGEMVLPDNGAFICTTSGSTGRPKAITITHSSFSSVVAHNPEMGMGSDSRVFQFASYTFDTANSEIWAPLILGACVCIPSENERMNDTAGAINRLAVNWSFFTPSMASLLTPADIPGLKTLALGGELVREDIVKTWKGHARVINSFGPAECSVWTTMADIGHGNPVTTINKGNGGYGSLLWIADTSDKGICQRKLTAVVALQQFSERTMVSKELRPISPENAKTAAEQTEEIKEQLRSRVPGYMVPTSWLIVESMALTPSKKVDRVTIARWVETLSNETYTQALDTTAAADQGTIVEQDNLSPEVKLIQRIIATVLNIPLDQVDLNKSFLNLGGDSIQAIGTVVQCRKEGLRLTVKAIMQSKSLHSLAAAAEKSDQPQSQQQEDLVDVPFELSPIQKLYFSDIARSSREPEANHFNQSFLLAVTAKQGADEVANALRQLVEYHPLLRARYSLDKDGSWTQMVPKQVEGSFHFASYAVDSDEEARAIARKQQEQHCIESGPVFASVLLNIEDTGKQLLFLTAHHLVIDLVSWRIIIRQLEDLLTVKGSQLPALKPFPFHSWIKAQADYSAQHLTPESALLHELPAADYSYWGMQGEQNLRRDIAEFKFTLNANSTDGLLRNCHSSMKTEALDILLAAAFSSFTEAFSRTPPAIFNEGHGRESWDSSRIDVTETVGWFTTMYPLHVSPLEDDLTGTVQQLKDQRRSLPRKGWSYFNSAVSNPAGRAAFAKHWPVEILFNYLGVYQGQEQQAASGEDASLLQIIPFNEGDFGPQVNRFALIDINTYVLDGKAHVSLTYNRNMRHIDQIERWVQLYQQTLDDMISTLEQSPRLLTPGDFPLLQNTSYTSLQELQKRFEPSGTPVDNIEDIYACSPMQEGILLTQNRIDGAYHIEMVVQVSSVRGAPIDVPRLVKAWQMVVDRQAVLRTVFVEGLSERPYDQLLLKEHSPLVKLLDQPEGDAVTYMNAQTQVFSPDQPPHCLTILHDTNIGLTLCKLEISHALVDGASMSILVSDWVEAYQNPTTANPGPLYSDYIGYIQSQPRAAAIDFWKSQLSGVRACHFPTIVESNAEVEETRPLRQVEVKIPEASQVRNFCQEHNVTLASIFRLAWAKVLRAFTGDEQVCFGYLASGREIPVAGIEEAVGAFINMLVCSIDFDATSQQSAITSLDKLQDEYLQSLPYQHVSLAEIQHELGLSSGQKLFNTVLSFQRRPHQDFFAGDLHLRYIDGVDPTEYPISVSISDDAGKIHVQMSYFASIMSDAQAASVSNALSSILASILDRPQAPVAQLKMESDEDRRQIFSWNSDIPATVDKCVHAVFNESVKRAPEAIAIDSFEGTMSYSELDLKSSILATQLMQQGVTVGDFVPIAFEKSVWAIVSMMGIMKAGAGYVPLDMAHPDDRLKTIISQLVDVRLVLASQKNTKRMQILADNVLTVSSGTLLDTKSTPVVLPAVIPESSAYCLFTSGTSGVPKGVVLSHRAVNSSTFHHGALIGCNSATRMYQFAAFTFDACILEIFTTLMYGGTICLPSDEERMSDIIGFINRKQVNTAFMTPSVVRIVKPEDIPSMETLILGGEALGADNIATWANRLRLMNGYGPTETCVFAVMKTFERTTDRNDVLGKGVASQTWIVNPDDPSQLAPLGAVGMLHLSGPALADGYLRDQTKTDSVFLESPGFLPGERAYNTGDRARYNDDGSIIYLGRADQQTKLRGQRIELAEIETHTLKNLPEASGVCVDIVFPGGLQDKACLAAFFCLDKKDKSLPGEDLLLPVAESVQNDIVRLQRALEAALPPYEVPALYIPVSKMPTTTAGKLDRRTLRETISSMPQEELLRMYSQTESSKKPLTTVAEQTLALAWSEVLKIPVSRIGSDDNFFRVGGDSISAMVLASKRVATVADIFKHPVLSDMAAVSSSKTSSRDSGSETVAPFSLLDGSATVSSIAAKGKLSPDDVEDAYPCTPLQEGLMALSLLNPGSYILRKVLRLPASMDIPMFKDAWEMTVANNPILRTTIVEGLDARSLQVVLKHNSTSLWRTASSLQEYLDQDEEESFTFGTPLSRYGITADGHFVWTAHHSIYDGWTLPLILNQVRAFYTSNVPKRVPSFNSFIKYITSTTHEEAQTYWTKSLSGGKPIIAYPEPPAATHTHRHRVDGVAHQKIAMQLQPESDVPTATLLRAAWAYVLAQYSDAGEDNDIVFGTTLSGRSCPVDEITEIVGPTITTVPVRMGIPTGETSVRTFLKTVQDQTTDMMPFEHFGLRNIANINADTAAAIQFQNLFVVQPMAQRFDIQPQELLVQP